MHISKSQFAAALWDYGEDELATRAIEMTDAELASIESISTWYEDPAYPLPMSGQRITHNHVTQPRQSLSSKKACGHWRGPAVVRSGIAPRPSSLNRHPSRTAPEEARGSAAVSTA